MCPRPTATLKRRASGWAEADSRYSYGLLNLRVGPYFRSGQSVMCLRPGCMASWCPYDCDGQCDVLVTAQKLQVILIADLISACFRVKSEDCCAEQIGRRCTHFGKCAICSSNHANAHCGTTRAEHRVCRTMFSNRPVCQLNCLRPAVTGSAIGTCGPVALIVLPTLECACMVRTQGRRTAIAV